LKIDIRVLPRDTDRGQVYTVLKKEALLKFLGSEPSKNGREISASQTRDFPPFCQVLFETSFVTLFL